MPEEQGSHSREALGEAVVKGQEEGFGRQLGAVGLITLKLRIGDAIKVGF